MWCDQERDGLGWWIASWRVCECLSFRFWGRRMVRRRQKVGFPLAFLVGFLAFGSPKSLWGEYASTHHITEYASTQRLVKDFLNGRKDSSNWPCWCIWNCRTIGSRVSSNGSWMATTSSWVPQTHSPTTNGNDLGLERYWSVGQKNQTTEVILGC